MPDDKPFKVRRNVIEDLDEWLVDYGKVEGLPTVEHFDNQEDAERQCFKMTLAYQIGYAKGRADAGEAFKSGVKWLIDKIEDKVDDELKEGGQGE